MADTFRLVNAAGLLIMITVSHIPPAVSRFPRPANESRNSSFFIVSHDSEEVFHG